MPTARDALRADFTLAFKNFQYSKKKSGKTPYFSADLWLDGVYAGWVHNNGTGSTCWQLPNEREQQAFIRWVNTLPDMWGDRADPTGSFKATWEYVLCLMAITTLEYMDLCKKVRRTGKIAFLLLDDQFQWQQCVAAHTDLVKVSTSPNVCGLVTRCGASLKYDVWGNITLPILWHDTK